MNFLEESGVLFKSEKRDIVSKDLEVFYNPVMKLNRDITIEVLKYYFKNFIEKRKLKIALPLAASGIRALRFLNEIPEYFEEIYVNDYKVDFKKTLKVNLKLNKFKRSVKNKIIIKNTEANIFLRQNGHFDFIDIDPYGSPVPFLESAISKIRHNGILAITATDTSSLAGSYPSVCMRRYWSKPLRNHLKHEVGLRILIKSAQMLASQQDKVLIPILSYSKEHYMRIFFKVTDSKSHATKIIDEHKNILYCNSCCNYEILEKIEGKCSICKKDYVYAGPLFTGNLGDYNLIKNFKEQKEDNSYTKFINLLKEEYKENILGFYDIHEFASKHKFAIPKKQLIIEKLKSKNIKCSETHFLGEGIKVDLNSKEFLKFLK